MGRKDLLHKLELKRFKKFSNATFNLRPSGLSLLAGGNNSGKSTMLQALAVWEFCIVVLRNEKGDGSLLSGYRGQGVGLSDDEFSPVTLPSFSHLWTNLTNQIRNEDGYSLSIRPYWKNDKGEERYLEISLSLANDRLFIKATASNLASDDRIPRIAFIPPFAGVSAKEQKMSTAQRRALIGSGLVGAIIRNILFDLQQANHEKRRNLKAGRQKIKTSDLRELRKTDPWEILQATLGQYFNTSLSVEPFNELYHSYLRVRLTKGDWKGTRIQKYPKFKARDLMSEGSGFLQWLSVFSLSLDPTIDVVLLDEPDAHLHSSMQTQLLSELEKIISIQNKQVLLATHSTEILRWADHEKILRFRDNAAKYLQDDEGKIGLFAGLGSDFAPRLDKLRAGKCLFIVENKSDARFIEIFSNAIGRPIHNDIVVWPWTGSSKERRQLFFQLKKEIPNLQAISIRDRDDASQNLVDPTTLRDVSENDFGDDGLHLRMWQRRHIENYLLCPSAIARTTGVDQEKIMDFFREAHGLHIPKNYQASDVVAAIKDARGKEIIETGSNSVAKKFGISKFDIAKNMKKSEVGEDITNLILQIRDLNTP